MVYKIEYQLDDGYAKQDMAVVVNSRDIISTDKEAREFLYKNLHKRSDDVVHIYDYELINPDYTDRVILKKVVRY